MESKLTNHITAIYIFKLHPYRDTPPTSPISHYNKKTDSNIQYESLKTPPTNAIDMANTYETIGTPKVNASSTPYETVGSPPVYTYAKVDTPIKVVLPGNNQSEGFDGKTIVSPNVAYGSSLVDNEAYVTMSNKLEVSSKEIADNPLYGSTET